MDKWETGSRAIVFLGCDLTLLPTQHRALARVGNVHYKQQNWEQAVKFFDKSLAEHRNPDIVTKKNDVSGVPYEGIMDSIHHFP